MQVYVLNRFYRPGVWTNPFVCIKCVSYEMLPPLNMMQTVFCLYSTSLVEQLLLDERRCAVFISCGCLWWKCQPSMFQTCSILDILGLNVCQWHVYICFSSRKTCTTLARLRPTFKNNQISNCAPMNMQGYSKSLDTHPTSSMPVCLSQLQSVMALMTLLCIHWNLCCSNAVNRTNFDAYSWVSL